MDTIKFNFENMKAENFAIKEQGISDAEIVNYLDQASYAYRNVLINESKETKAYLDLVRQPKDLDEIKDYANQIAENFDNFVVLGIGGSALGARALFSALTDINYKRCKDIRNKRPKWFIRDSINPEKFVSLLSQLNLKKTMFCVVTKSGGTLETLVQLSIVIEKLQEEMGEEYTNNICVVTSNLDGKLNKWAVENNVKTFYFSNDVSGRFSVFSAVGLLPAAVAGIDIDKILEGANYMLETCKNKELTENPALYGAVLQKISMDRGFNVSYLMPYADRLKVLADWYCQLWAESLGKRIVVDGKEKCVGQTPVRALGTVDQHSQMQLCLEGIYDKVISFIRVNNYKRDVVIKNLNNGLLDDYICDRKLSEILNASQQATEQALLDCSRMSRTIEIDTLDEFTMGALMMYYMLETSFVGEMLHLNTYNQPSVELIKINIRKLLIENKDDEI